MAAPAEKQIITTEKSKDKWLYGTFEAASPSGWMLELDRYLGDFQTLVWIYSGLAVVLSLCWPVAWIGGVVASVLANKWNRRDLYAVAFQLFFATGLGLLLSVGPFFFSHMSPGGLLGMAERIENRELAGVDMQAPWKAQMFLMLLYYFCLMYQDVNEQIVEVKKWVVPYLKRQVHSLELHPEQRERIDQFIKDSGDASEGDLCDLLKVLETMPGWGSPAEGGVDNEARGFFEIIHKEERKAHSRGLFGLDVYTLHQMKYNLRAQIGVEGEVEPIVFYEAITEEATVAKARCVDTMSYVLGYLKEYPLSLALVTFLALCRISIPRLWLAYYLEGMLLPHSYWPLLFVALSTLTTFICYFLFMGLFLVMVFEYQSNAQQLALLTGLINMDARCQYAEKVLVDCCQLPPEESEILMSRLPLLNLQKSRNAIGFWSLRDYVLLDRSNDRVGMQILIATVILLILFNLILAAYDMYTLPWISPFIPIVLFDVLVMGVLIMYSLQQALLMNNWMSSHTKYFNQAVHDIMGTQADIMTGQHTLDEADVNLKIQVADLTLARKFLKSAVVMVHENDPREALLFGVEVTPGGVASSAAGFLGTVGYFIYTMIKTGSNPMDHLKQDKVAFTSTKFLMQWYAKKLI